MKMRRIILADSELNYIVKLQIKFLQELQDAYVIDVISDREYLDACFSSPQNADCLIINEKWAYPALAKHNVDHIVILTDSKGDVTQSDFLRPGIPRNTSTEEIYNQIRNILGIKSTQGEKKEATVIFFGSASGGTGKTVLSLCMADYFSRKYYRVLYVNNQSSQSFQYYLKNQNTVSTEAAMALVDAKESDIFPILKKQIREEGFYYLPPFAMPLFSYGIYQDVYTAFIRGAKASREFDYVIIDSGSDLTYGVAEQLALSDRIIMVIKPNEEYHYALKQLFNKISIKEDNIIVLCNRKVPNTINDAHKSELVEINECISEWGNIIDADTIHVFSDTDDIKKIAVLIG